MTNSTTQITSKDLIALSNKIVKDVKAGLFVGRGNVQPDLTKTNYWSNELVISTRSNRKWKKIVDNKGKTSCKQDSGDNYMETWHRQFVQKKPSKLEIESAVNEQLAR